MASGFRQLSRRVSTLLSNHAAQRSPSAKTTALFVAMFSAFSLPIAALHAAPVESSADSLPIAALHAAPVESSADSLPIAAPHAVPVESSAELRRLLADEGRRIEAEFLTADEVRSAHSQQERTLPEYERRLAIEGRALAVEGRALAAKGRAFAARGSANIVADK